MSNLVVSKQMNADPETVFERVTDFDTSTVVTATAALREFWADQEFSETVQTKASLLGSLLEQLAERHSSMIRCTCTTS